MKIIVAIGYLPTFWYFLAFGEGLGLFDLLVIDLLWWRNTKRIRFSFLPEKGADSPLVLSWQFYHTVT